MKANFDIGAWLSWLEHVWLRYEVRRTWRTTELFTWFRHTSCRNDM